MQQTLYLPISHLEPTKERKEKRREEKRREEKEYWKKYGEHYYYLHT